MEMKFLEKQTLRIISALVSFGLLLFIGVMGGESAWAQGLGKERMKDQFDRLAERNPFLLPPGVSLLAKGEAHGRTDKSESAAKSEMKPLIMSQPAPLRVKAILIGDTIRLAAIDKYIVGVGDAIKDEKVLEIEPDRVILGKGDDKRTLLLSQSRIPLRVQEK
jgi:hypothetical protein